MTTIILGGAPGANWMPFLLPLAGIFLLVAGGDLLVRFLKRRVWRRKH